MKNLPIFISAFLFIIFNTLLQSQPGALDQSFGEDGSVIFTENSFTHRGFAAAVQSDGKVLVGGFQELIDVQDFAVVRFNSDGSVDNTFGTNGKVVIDGGETAESVWTIMVQNDGRILLGGSIYHQFTTYDDFALIRLNPDGSLDNSFGNAGIVSTDIEEGWDNAYSMAIQDDGKILLGGDGYRNDKRNATIVRYNIDGSVDESFGFLGVGWLSVGTVNDKTKDIALQNDGKIIVVGAMNDGLDDQAFVARFTADGAVDTFFGNNGMFTLDIGAREDRLWSVCVEDDGSIIAGGYTRDENAMDNDYLFIKLNSDGTQDLNFGSNGIRMFHYGPNDQVIDMTIQDDGKILSAGSAFSFEILRLLENGDLDPSFGDNGKVNTTVGTYCHANAICLYPDDRIIVAGQAKNNDIDNFAAARYHLAGEGGVSEIENEFSNLKMYPNPVTGNAFILGYTVDTKQEVSIELLSSGGQVVGVLLESQSRTQGQHTEILQLPQNLSSGIYFIRISSAESATTIRLEKL